MTTINLGWNPKRVLFGFSRISHKPHTALADIIDNSVSSGATEINILIEKENDNLANNRENNVSEYIIIDNGKGMNYDEIKKAFELGSSDLNYDAGSLSKFGLGLKSASFSQGNLLEIISSSGNGFLKGSVDLDEIEDRYFCKHHELNKQDESLIKEYLSTNKGTIIRIKKIHKNNHPSLKKTVDELKNRLGIIYYYFLEENDLEIKLNEEKIAAYDVLFTSEADENQNLNEHEWDGRTVNWIKKPISQPLEVKSEPKVKALIEVTQLPHPPTFDLDGDGERKKVRDKYKIEASNYGYYVYRNKRLISWAERFNGIIPQDQDFYSFRGRILLDDSADDAFNIDVKKSHLELSSEAWNALNDLSDEYKRKSKLAWKNAIKLKTQKIGNDTNTVSNNIVEDIDTDDLLLDPSSTPEEEKKRAQKENDIKKEIKGKVENDAKEFIKSAEGKEETTDEEIEEYATGKSSIEKKIFRVKHIEDNLLWEPYYDDEHGYCVRINKNHRFSRLIFEDNKSNTDMSIIFDLILYHFILAEINVKTRSKVKENDNAIQEYRAEVSDLLTKLLRNKDIKLPPNL